MRRPPSRDAIADGIVTMAAPTGVTVTMYGQDDTGIQVWTKTEVPGLMVLGTAMNLFQGKSLGEAMSTAPTIKDFRTAGIS